METINLPTTTTASTTTLPELMEGSASLLNSSASAFDGITRIIESCNKTKCELFKSEQEYQVNLKKIEVLSKIKFQNQEIVSTNFNQSLKTETVLCAQVLSSPEFDSVSKLDAYKLFLSATSEDYKELCNTLRRK